MHRAPEFRLAPVRRNGYKTVAGVESVAGRRDMLERLTICVLLVFAAQWGTVRTASSDDVTQAASRSGRIRYCPCPSGSSGVIRVPIQSECRIPAPQGNGPVQLLRLTREIPDPAKNAGRSSGASRVPVHVEGYSPAATGTEPFRLLRLTREIPESVRTASRSSSSNCAPDQSDGDGRVPPGKGSVRLLQMTREVPVRASDSR
jgi:hypothetical protein